MYIPIQTERLYEQIVSQIEQRIEKGELKVGDQLPAERELAEQFAVSRTAVREAIKALREKGWVEILAGRGTFITNGASDKIKKSLGLLMKFGTVNGTAYLVEVRGLLEPEIAAIAATRITDEYIAAMQDAVNIMETATAANNADAFVEADIDFHIALAEATQNPIILVLMDSIIALLREQRKRTGNVAHGLNRGQLHHKIILEAVMKRDPEAARKAMQNHLQQVLEDSN